MIIFRQKLYTGAVKAANKVAKKAWESKMSHSVLPGRNVDPRVNLSAFRVGNRASKVVAKPKFELRDRGASITGQVNSNLHTRINAKGSFRNTHKSGGRIMNMTPNNLTITKSSVSGSITNNPSIRQERGILREGISNNFRY